MNLFKKMMTGVAVGALTLAVAGGVGSVSADAAAIKATPNAAEQTITVPKSGNKEVMVAYPTVKAGKLTVKSWDVYEAPAKGDYVIDVSALNATKDNYVMVKSDSADPVLIKFAAVNAKIKAVYNAGTAQIAFDGAAEDAGFQYRTASGSWAEFTNGTTDLTRYEMAGSTVYFRETPSDDVTVEKAEEVEMGDEKITVSKVVSFGGKEIKVKITKRANGPKATVNLDAGTYVVAKKGTSYRNANTGEWTTTTEDKQTVTVDITEDGVFEVKTAKVEDNDAKKAKPESRITQYAYAAAKTVTTSKTGSATIDIKDNGTKDAESKEELTFSYQTPKAGAETYPGIVVKNAGKAAYQVIITSETDTSKFTDTKTYKSTAVAGGKEVKIAASKMKDGDLVYVRYASDKKTGAWASEYKLVGKVSLAVPSEEE